MRYLLFAGSIFALAACGGGGDSPTPVTMPPSSNAAPQISTGPAATVTENQSAVVTVQATDANGDSLSFSISGGDDADDFSITASGSLSFASPPNFELPTDVNQDNVYQLTVQVSDGSASDTLDVTVTVENDREGITIRRIASGLVDVTAITSPNATDQLFVAERGGRIHLFDTNTEQLSLDRTLSNVNVDGEGGLLGLAADPDEAGIYWAFVVAQTTGSFATPGSNITIRRIQRSFPELPQGRGTLLEIPHPATENYGGGIGFDPINKHLFIAVGDAGNPENAQNTDNFLGKILRYRINPDPFAGAAPASLILPVENNPFFGGGGDAAIYGLGVQNPQDISFDGRFLVFGDSGNDRVEEINAVVSDSNGENFGWPFFEGSIAFQGATSEVLTAPRSEYNRGNGDREGMEVQTGRVYPGPVAVLQGKFIFADKQNGKIWAVPTTDLVTGQLLPSTQYELLNADFSAQNVTVGNIVAFVIAGGDLYFADSNGSLFKLEAG